jgi:hypothetical protein
LVSPVVEGIKQRRKSVVSCVTGLAGEPDRERDGDARVGYRHRLGKSGNEMDGPLESNAFLLLLETWGLYVRR